MYLTNKYTKWYKNIIAKAQERVNQNGYFEKHHIIPRSLGGTDDPSNLVKLTAKEHFICHLLLTKMVTGVHKRSMYYASYMMVRGIRNQHYKPSSITYAIVRENMIAANKERPGPNLGSTMSEETKAKISASLKGRAQPERTAEHSAKLGQYVRTDEHRKILSDFRKSQKGKQTRTAETKSKMSAWQKGVPKPVLACNHCGKSISDLNYRRWHGDKCKSI